MEYPFVVNSSSDGRPALLTAFPELALSYVVVVGVVSVVGTLGNLLVIGTLVSASRPCGCSWPGGMPVTPASRLGRVAGDVFILNLACSDMVITSVINPFAIIGVVLGSEFFTRLPALCGTLASVCVVSCIGSLLSILCISVNRYVYICHQGAYNKVFTDRKSLLMVMGVWILAVFVDLPTHLGWSQKTFDQKSHKCLWDRRKSYSYTLFLALVGMMLPLVLMSIFYARIFISMDAARKKLMNFSAEHTNCHKCFFKLMRQARMMVVIFSAFAVCWTPYILVLIVDKNDRLPLWVHLLASLIAHTHASVNFFIYGVGNRKIRKGYQRLITYLFCCGRSPLQPRGHSALSHGQMALHRDLTSGPGGHRTHEERAITFLLKDNPLEPTGPHTDPPSIQRLSSDYDDQNIMLHERPSDTQKNGGLHVYMSTEQ